MRTLGKTIVLTTHYMDEAQYLADRICVIAAGQVVAQGTPETLRAGTEQLTHIRFELPDGVVASALPLSVRFEDGIAIIETATSDPDPQRPHHLGGGERTRAAQPRGHPSIPRRRVPGADQA